VRLFKKKNNYPKHEFPTILAFTAGGVDYFQYEDITNIPPVRGLKSMVFYEELKMKCTFPYLDLYTQAVDNILSKNPIDVFKIKRLNEQLKERLNIALETEIVYKLASVVFFDKEENVNDYDFDYNKKKIAFWKESMTHQLFFSQLPLTNFLPFLKDVNVNFDMYSLMVEELNKYHLENLLKELPVAKTEKLKNKSYFSQMIMPES
jgi:hypothetical protein